MLPPEKNQKTVLAREMPQDILGRETVIRLTVFFSVLIGIAVWEVAVTRRRLEIPRLLRWSNNLALVVLDTLLVRLAFPVVAVGLAVVAQENG